MVYRTSFIFGIILLSMVYCSSDGWTQRLNVLTKEKFGQGQSELVFLLDRSGSVGAANFEIEKGFVENLLTNFVVAPNATRVAVISYSTAATLHIDYIKSPKNKCFLSEEIQEVTYEGSRQTNTASALLEAKKVLRNARKNVNRAVILLSDGISTAGKDPVLAANSLKKENVEIFTFAIGKFLQVELNAIATDTKHTFNTLNFKEFRKLARKIRGDPHETKWQSGESKKSCNYLCNNPYVGQDFDPGCCDFNAKCTCGLVSGLHTCVCGPGYFGESGLRGQCTACPIGTYKSSYEPTFKCNKCPRRSTTNGEASTSISDCKCLPGYVGDPSIGKLCKIKKCPPLQKPTKGRIIGRCSRKYKSTCSFTCDIGYRIQRRNSQTRKCQADGTWSATPAICIRVHCSNLDSPRFGVKTCTQSDNSWGTVCNFKCNVGFSIAGPNSRICGPGALWSRYQPECRIVTCPVKKQLEYGRVTPASCVSKRTSFGKICLFKCLRGFQRVGPYYQICNQYGNWEGYDQDQKKIWTDPECIDVENPTVNCSQPIIVKAKPGLDYAWVSWKKPKFLDNSGVEPKVVWYPNYRKEKAKFKIGEHRIEYKASDKAFLSTVCTVRIVVIDREPPKVTYCPSDITANITELEEIVNWDPPKFEDNSNEALTIFASNNPGEKFQFGEWFIVYIATDPSGNEAMCEFTVTVNKFTCPYHAPPVNGALTCSEWLRGEFCQVYCNNRFDFARKPANWYICDSKSIWKTVPPNYGIPWPDCSDWHIPKAKRKIIGHYFSGNCKDQKVKSSLRKKFVDYFKMKFDQSKLCKGVTSCTVQSVKVSCGKLKNGVGSGKVKRSAKFFQEMDVEVEFTVAANANVSQSKSFIQNLVSAADHLLTEDEFQNRNLLQSVQREDVLVNEDKNTTASNTVLICDVGQVKNNEECINCPVGTFYDEEEKQCQNCAVGYYQNMEAQTACMRCPEGQWTIGEHNRNFTECREICKEGTYSETGLATCISCPRGTYQDEDGKRECKKCPKGKTTWVTQAMNISFCRKKCQPGSFSDTGLEPCEPCHRGYYQDQDGQQRCKECPENLTTIQKGRTARGFCKLVNHCKRNPCKNNGVCQSMKNYPVCLCRNGFKGQFCDNQMDECESSPCQHNSTCIDKIGSYECICQDGFTGENCDKEINECFLFPCLNGGTCTDKLGEYDCFCPKGFGGSRCEVDLDLCQNVTCNNHGTCKDLKEKYVCECDEGFEGVICERDKDECLGVECRNGGSCVDGWNNFTCQCDDGYGGRFCETNIDDCLGNECMNRATCIDLVNKYTCKCRPGFLGSFCEMDSPENFTMEFAEAKLSSYVLKEDIPEIEEITVDFWTKIQLQKRRIGTILSYAAMNNDELLDNAFTLMDVASLKVFINNNPIDTDMELDDGKWHRVTVSWSGRTKGSFKIWKDGILHNSGAHSMAKKIPGNGILVLGQDQDQIGGNFNLIESFEGKIANLNIWKSAYTPEELGDTCLQLDKGNTNLMMAWSDFSSSIHGDIKLHVGRCLT